jgi:hypothetical protein
VRPAGADPGRDVAGKTGRAAEVLADLLAVDEDPRVPIDAAEVEQKPLATRKRWRATSLRSYHTDSMKPVRAMPDRRLSGANGTMIVLPPSIPARRSITRLAGSARNVQAPFRLCQRARSSSGRGCSGRGISRDAIKAAFLCGGKGGRAMPARSDDQSS